MREGVHEQIEREAAGAGEAYGSAGTDELDRRLASLCVEAGMEPGSLDTLVDWARGRANELLSLPAGPPAASKPSIRALPSDEAPPAEPATPTVAPPERTEEFELDVDDDALEFEIEAEFEAEPCAEADAEPESEAPTRGPGVPEVVLDPGTWPVAPFRVTFNTWRALVDTWDQQLRHGGFFVQTEQRLGLEDEAELTFVLPRYRLELRVAARVLQMVPGETPGVAMRFVGVGPSRMEGMARLVETARLYEAGGDLDPDPSVLRVTALDDGSYRWHLTPAEQAELQDLTTERARLARAEPARVLGVEPGTALPRARERFFDLANRWHPRQYQAPELREVAQDLFLAVERAYQRYAEAASNSSPVPPPASAQTRPTDAAADLREAEAARSGVFTGRALLETQRPRRKRRATSVLARKLLEDMGVTAAGTSRDPGGKGGEVDPQTSPSAPTDTATDNATVRPVEADEPVKAHSSFERALSAATNRLQEKRYDDAIELFETAVRLRPQSKRAQVLLGFARARQAVQRKDFTGASAAYDAILAIDPTNERATKEQTLIAAYAQPGRSS